jgi:hypothetical protein
MTDFGGWLRKAARRRYAQLIHRLLSANIGNRGFRPEADACSVRMVRPSSGQFGGSALRVAIVDRRAP